MLLRQHMVQKAGKAGVQLHSLPGYYGMCALLWVVLPGAILTYLLLRYAPENLPNAVPAGALSLAIIGGFIALGRWFSPQFRARQHTEKWINALLLISTVLAVSITVLIVFSILVEALAFFEKVSWKEFFFGTHWSPQMAGHGGHGEGSFGAIPVFLGTLLITFIAMCIAGPLGLLSAIYLSEYAPKRFRSIAKPLLEILAGIPTVVYGFFAAVTFAPMLRDLGEFLHLDVASESALAAGLVMGVMIIPFVLSLSDDVMKAVPKALRDASLGLGATRSETIRQVVIPAALPGIMGALLLAISRAIGETMIVVMAAGLTANLTLNPFDSVTTVTTQIVTLLVGDQEFDSAKTLSAFALSLTLFVVTLLLNIIALMIVKKYREKYD